MSRLKHLMGLERLIFLLLVVVLLSQPGCRRKAELTHAPGFDLAGSDRKAVEIANKVVEACGGWENWNKTRFVSWRFFDRRLHVWDKWTGDIRVESRITIVLMNLHTMKGRAWKTGLEITDPDELQRAIEYGYEMWINDSYWIFMPFKLTDSGVTLKYLGEHEVDERPVDKLSLTFKEVGVTPENKYNVYVDRESKLPIRWDFYMDAADDTLRFTNSWGNYQKYGNILLSDNRGKRSHTDLAVFDELPESVLKSPEPVDFSKLSATN